MILGIDQSLTATGLCLSTNALEVMVIKTLDTEKMSNVDRIETVISGIDSLIQTAGFAEPFTVVREGYSFQSRTNNAFQLGELGGCINQLLHKYALRIRIMILPPTTVKLLTLGSGGIKKDSAYLMKVFKCTGKEFEDDNQADAFLLCKAGFILYSIADVEDCSSLVNGLTTEQRMGLIPPSVRKRNKLTEAKVKKLTASDLRTMVSEAVATVYGLH